MVAPTFNSHIDDARARVDTRIAETKELLRAVKEGRNNLSCAVRVPPEILAHIFLYIMRDMYEDNNQNSIEQLYLPHVCRYWYQVASHSQQYWRYQPLRLEGNRRFHAPHVVERAGGRPLYLWGIVWVKRKWDHSECELISQHLSQAESINLMIRRSTPTYYDPEEEVPKSNPPYLATFLKKKAPNLKALSLYIETDEPFQINVDAFEGHTPTISSLYLIRFSWSWSAPLFSPSLTSLILYGPVMWGNKCVKTLQHLPLLHHLQLTDTDALRREDRGIIVPIHHSPSVKLEHLKTLELKGGRVDVTKLSLELDIPLSTTIFLTSPHVFAIPKDDDTCPEFESLFSFASRWIERRQRKRIFPRVLHVKSDIPNYAMGLTFHLWGPRVRITSTRGLFRIADTAPSFQLRLDAHYPAPLLKRRDRCTFYPGWMLRRVIPHLPLTEVHTLYLEQLPSMVDSRTAFEGLSGVHTLCVYDYQECIFRDLITGLPNDKDSHKGHSEQEDVLFPALNTVILLNTYARGRVLEFVAERARLNHAVSTLRLVDHSPVSDQWLEELRQHVANVVWDSNKVEVLKLVDSDDDLSTYSESREEE